MRIFNFFLMIILDDKKNVLLKFYVQNNNVILVSILILSFSIYSVSNILHVFKTINVSLKIQ